MGELAHEHVWDDYSDKYYTEGGFTPMYTVSVRCMKCGALLTVRANNMARADSVVYPATGLHCSDYGLTPLAFDEQRAAGYAYEQSACERSAAAREAFMAGWAVRHGRSDPDETLDETTSHTNVTTLGVMSVKRTREALCAACVALRGRPEGRYAAMLQDLINQCDEHRPLGPDGKHGDLHTPTCGCDDQ